VIAAIGVACTFVNRAHVNLARTGHPFLTRGGRRVIDCQLAALAESHGYSPTEEPATPMAQTFAAMNRQPPQGDRKTGFFLTLWEADTT